MQSIHGSFSIHRVKTVRGKDAVMLVPDNDEVPLSYVMDDATDEASFPISFEHVEGGENPPDSYLTITYANGDKVRFGPQVLPNRMKN